MSILSVTRPDCQGKFDYAGMLDTAREAYHTGCNQKHMLPYTNARLDLPNQS